MRHLPFKKVRRDRGIRKGEILHPKI